MPESEPSHGVVAWAVIYGNASQYTALFLDEGRARQYAADCHGVLRPLRWADE